MKLNYRIFLYAFKQICVCDTEDTQCWSGEHFPLAIIAVVGLIIWCVGLPLGLFLRICSSSDRQSQENFRKFGFFIEGFEPSFWWWDIIVKRFDIATMTLVAYTSLAPDDRAKLLLFPILSAFQLYLSALCRPFADDQAELLDFLDTFLLALRFFCFSSLAVVILLNPSAEATEAMSVTVLVVLVVGFSYFAVHAASQVLRKWSLSWEQDTDSSSMESCLELNVLMFFQSFSDARKTNRETCQNACAFVQGEIHVIVTFL